MKIGLRAHDYGKLPIEELLTRIKADGFNSIQLAIPKAIEGINSHDEVNEEVIKEIKNACDKHDVTIAVLGCYIDPALLDKTARLKAVNTFLKTMEYVKPLGAGCIGTETTHFYGSESERMEAFERLVDSVIQMVKKAEELQVNVGIEPVANHVLNTPELAKRLLDRISSERLKIILDPVNLLTAENIESQDEIWDKCFELFGDKICALHIKSICLNASGELETPTLKDGVVHFPKIIDWLKVNKPDIALLREEINPLEAIADRNYIMSLIS